jgi:beta-glucanase (GH16 family)
MNANLRSLPYGHLAVIIFFLSLGIAQAGWKLVWNDEFDSNAIDTNNWAFDTGNGAGGWGNRELEYYTSRSQNAFVSNGLLHIVAVKEPYSGFRYTSAKLKSFRLFSKKFGRFEFRARLPYGQGFWPALWMMPEDSVHGGWPASGEIDVMENRGSNAATVLGTIHFGGAYPKNTHSVGPSFTFEDGDSVTNYHVYAVEWTTNSIKWYVDKHLYETQTSWWSSSNLANISVRNPYPAPFDEPFYIIMNLAVGGKFGGNPDGTTQFPGEMLVDYVRVYDWTGGPPTSLAAAAGRAGDGRIASEDNHKAVPGSALSQTNAQRGLTSSASSEP